MPAEVQHGGDPFQGPVADPEDRDPAAGDGVIDTAAAGDRGVEAAGERDRRGVGDLVLHRGHRADPAPDQGRGGAGEQVTGPGRGAGAGVQHHQAGHRAGLAQQVDQPVRGDQVGAPVLADQGQHALVPAGVEVAVPDEVQHMPLPVQQQVLQVRPGRAGRPVQLGQALAGRPGQRAGQLVLFLLHVQGRQAARGGNHAQDPQRRPDLQRRRHRGDRDVADQLVLPTHVRPRSLVIHRLPRQPRQRRGIDPQHHPQPLPPLGGHRRGGPVPPGHLAGPQQPGEQHLAGLPHRLLGLRQHPAAGHRRGQHRLLQQSAPRQQRIRIQLDFRRRLPRGGRHDLHPEHPRRAAGPDRHLDDRHDTRPGPYRFSPSSPQLVIFPPTSSDLPGWRRAMEESRRDPAVLSAHRAPVQAGQSTRSQRWRVRAGPRIHSGHRLGSLRHERGCTGARCGQAARTCVSLSRSSASMLSGGRRRIQRVM